MFEVLVTTILKRPYVVAFLISYLVIAFRVVGLRWTVFYFFIGYTVAFLSEFLSIHYGFPYGDYTYIYENLKGEWLNNGVPVWDSVSYIFMNFAGLCAARLCIGSSFAPKFHDKVKLVVIAAVFVTLLDVIIDPVAHLGANWFLGKIYFYPHPGPYFDVTIANFWGWFATSLVINGLGVFALGFYNVECLENTRNRTLSLSLYYGIFGFGIVIAVYLRQWLLFACDLGWLMLTIFLMTRNNFKTSTIPPSNLSSRRGYP